MTTIGSRIEETGTLIREAVADQLRFLNRIDAADRT